MMPEGGLIEWFVALSVWQKGFVGLFVVFIALPIAALTVLQFVETLRSSRESTRNYGSARNEDDRK